MAIAHASEIVSVWTENNRPTRLVWRGARYLVTDTPTPINEPFDDVAPTHAAHRIVGWRFQGRSVNDGDTKVFDVLQLEGTRWQLTGVYA
ncbi:hypothetical protein [Leifsonia shinshuensis]|uniref:Uncharacterized protein n=1 Tax=Leifsonia shinshuensis TaxID=150026 RepID=A0A7G6YBK4_9MICO|nr:hypothetical protein [Leifsonia shinshuensis]QNE35869.1 hypothetical protein F1C12_12525 [Leifsonia shinshuensis]